MLKNTFNLEVSWHTLWRVLIFGAVVSVLYLARGVLGVLFASVVISLGIDPIVSYLEKKRVHRILGTLIVFIMAFLILGIGIYFIIPIFAVEMSSFLEHFHEFMSATFGIGFPDNVVDALTFGKEKLFDYLSVADISVAATFSKFLETAIYLVVTVLTTFYLSVEKNGTERLFRVVLPDVYEAPVLKVFNRFKIKIRRWMVAQLSLSIIIGVVSGLGLMALGIRYSFVLGILAAILELVPVIGPIMVGIIAFLVAVSDSALLGVYALLFCFIVQQLENNILVPLIMGKSMKVHPVVVLMALLAGGKLAGFVGIVLAVPIAVIAQEIFNYLAEAKDRRTYLV